VVTQKLTSLFLPLFKDLTQVQIIMRNLRFLGLIAMMLAGGLYLQSCSKDTNDNKIQNTPLSSTEIQFTVGLSDFSDFKDFDPGDVPECADEELSIDYAVFTINNIDYISPILNANGKLLTQTVILNSGNYQLTSFLLFHDNLPFGPDENDVVLRAAPIPGTEYYDYIDNQLNINISVEDFIKKEILIDVLCYESSFKDEFGISWDKNFANRLERMHFFGDICVQDTNLYVNSAYENQENGLQADMPAIIKVIVYKNQEYLQTFSNEGLFHWDKSTQSWLGYYGEGAVLDVTWKNDEHLQETFTFELYVLLATENSEPTFQLVDTFTLLDCEHLETGPDGVFDFVIGNCSNGGADIIYQHRN